HLVGRSREQLVAPLERERAVLDRGAEQDLDVDLVVRAVDARGVVDGVRVDATAGRGVLNAAELRQAEVAPLADDTGAQLASVDANRIVVAIAALGVRLVGGLDERA